MGLAGALIIEVRILCPITWLINKLLLVRQRVSVVFVRLTKRVGSRAYILAIRIGSRHRLAQRGRSGLVFHKTKFVFEFLDGVLRRGGPQKLFRKEKSQICYCLLLRSKILIFRDYLMLQLKNSRLFGFGFALWAFGMDFWCISSAIKISLAARSLFFEPISPSNLVILSSRKRTIFSLAETEFSKRLTLSSFEVISRERNSYSSSRRTYFLAHKDDSLNGETSPRDFTKLKNFF